MASYMYFILLLLIAVLSKVKCAKKKDIDLQQTKVWGPGLKADFVVPVRYFFIQPISQDGENITESLGDKPFEVTLVQPSGQRVRVYMKVLYRNDGFYIVRFRIYQALNDLHVHIKYKGEHVARSPYLLKGAVHHELYNCPQPNIDEWFEVMECPASYRQINNDLSIFSKVDLEQTAREIVARFSKHPGSHSLCHYKIIDNHIYRKTYGQHVGFKMFSDAILLSLTRKVRLPDIEFFVNLGDWPLEKRTLKENPVPIFSWCGSEQTRDILMPTYDITEATLEMLGRQSLDIFSVMGNSPAPWQNKTEIGFWRGRDSRQERLDLVVMATEQPDLLDAKMTRMFFFKHEEKYGELVKSISFYDFFKYKYQVNIDGTVAAYRFPYLLAGDGVVFKQDSNYYEHFYKDLKPYEHYIPFKRDLSDLLEKIKWAKEHDEEVKQIGQNGRNFALNHLSPKDIFCYHVKLFNEYHKRLTSPPTDPDDSWELVEQPSGNDKPSDCKHEQGPEPKLKKHKKDEL